LSFEDIYSDLALVRQDTPDEQDLLLLIQDRVSYLLHHDKDLLLSYLYRLDIEEQKINNALMPGAGISAESAIAHLILERQKQRAETKKKYKQSPLPPDWQF
jgi:hypothetical protein